MEKLTACTMDCPDACSLLITVENGRAVKLRGNPDHPFTAGFTCKKIRRHLKRLQSPERILYPMLRNGKKWQRISWDEALNLCAEKITQLRKEPTAIAHVWGSGAKGINKDAVALFFHQLGASRTRGSLCDAAGVLAYHYDFGSRRNHGPDDLFNAHRIINWGRGVSRSSIHMASILKAARKKGIKVLLVSPCQEGDTAFRDHHILIRPGTDRLLAAAILHRLVVEEAIDRDIIDATRHWPKFRDMLRSRNEKALLEACDVSKADADLLHAYYTSDGAAATLVSGGLQRYLHGSANVRFINALALLSGNIGRKGGGSYFHQHSTGHFNMEWARPTQHTGRRSFQIATIGRDLISAKDPEIQMLWINGVNLVNQAPNSHLIVRAFEKVPFKVVVDAFFNDTASRADLVLPAALMLEQEDLIGSYLHNYIQYIPPVVEPPGEARTDLRIVRELGRRLRPVIDIPNSDHYLQAALNSPKISVSLDELRDTGYFEMPVPNVAYADLKFDHPDGKARLPLKLHSEPSPPEGYPLRLLSLAARDRLQSQTTAEAPATLPKVWVAPDCKALTSLNRQAPVYLASPLGRIQVELDIMPDLHPEAVVYRRGDWMALGGGVNQLISDQPTKIGGGTAYYHQYARLENG